MKSNSTQGAFTRNPRIALIVYTRVLAPAWVNDSSTHFVDAWGVVAGILKVI